MGFDEVRLSIDNPIPTDHNIANPFPKFLGILQSMTKTDFIKKAILSLLIVLPPFRMCWEETERPQDRSRRS